MKRKIYIISFIFFIVDLVSKIIVTNLKISMPIKIIKNFFYIDLVSNTGAAFSLLPGRTILLIIISILMLIYINKEIIKEIKDSISIVGCSMLTGGIIGNLYDRIFYGHVIDFLSFKFGSYYFPIFNLADTFICIGIFILIIKFIRGDLNEHNSGH